MKVIEWSLLLTTSRGSSLSKICEARMGELLVKDPITSSAILQYSSVEEYEACIDMCILASEPPAAYRV